ncbi:hypothetical protein MASR2M12_08470 [Bacteroidales bacterium]
MNDDKPHFDDGLLEAGKLNELRKLLTGLDQNELLKLQQLLNDPHEFSAEIGRLLPYSIRKLIESGELNQESLLPFVEETIHQSILKNPKRLANILFPVMGPAIRKAVSEDIKRMMASVNANLESGFSPQALKWRLQALFSKRSFAEIVLANSYLYHVSHVFLIHRETGLLLHEETAAESRPLESNLIASMLTAIRDFVGDSLKTADSGSLDEIQYGGLKILVEQGPYAILAVIAEGQPPADYRVTLMETIEAVHYNHSLDLEKFDGNTTVFQHTSKFLKQCLVREKKKKKPKPPFALIILSAVIFGLLTFLIIKGFHTRQRFEAFVNELEASPGYHISESNIRYNKLTVKGIKDPLAQMPHSMQSWQALDSSNVRLILEGYISTDSAIVLRRARQVLDPPESVRFYLEGTVLRVGGHCNADWQQKLQQNFRSIYGISQIDISGLNQNTVDLQWIVPAIEHHIFYFDVNIVRLDSIQQLQFDSLVKAAINLEAYNRIYGKTLAIHVGSFTNRHNTANEKVAAERAGEFIKLLIEAGVKEELLKSKVLFAEDLDRNVSLRSVHFSVFDTKPQ